MAWRSEYCYEPRPSRRHRAKYAPLDPIRVAREDVATIQREPAPVSAVGTVFPNSGMQGPLCPPDAVELKRTESGCLSRRVSDLGPIASFPAAARPARRRLRLPEEW